jgi:hypothetical protein
MFSNLVFLSCGLLVAAASSNGKPAEIKIKQCKKRKSMQKHIEREHYRKRRYSEPGAVEIGLIKAGDDLLDEVAGGAEMASLSEQQRRLLGVAEARPNVEDRLEIAVYPVVSRHFPKASLSLLALRATMRDFCTERERERERERGGYGAVILIYTYVRRE